MNSIQMLRALVFAVVVMVYTQVHAQITLKKHEEPGNSGYKSIVFEYEEDVPGQRGQKRKVTKEFGVEAHNPFYKIGLIENQEQPRTFKVDEKAVNDIRIKHGLQSIEVDQEVTGRTLAFIKKESDFIVISYNLFFEDSNGYQIDKMGQFSSIKILDKTGQVISKLEDIPTDAYAARVSQNGRFLNYAYGDSMYGDLETGFKIIDLRNSQVHFELRDIGYVNGVGSSEGMLTVVYPMEGGIGRQMIVVDEVTGNVYGPVSFRSIVGHLKFRRSDGTIIEEKDLNRLK